MTDFTGSESIKEIPSELSASTYVELIIVDKLISSTQLGTGPCGSDCNIVNEFKIIRDLFDPSDLTTIRSALCAKGKSTNDYVVYLRDFVSNVLTLADVNRDVMTRMSIIAVSHFLTAGELNFVLNHIRTHREILPSRVVR